MKILALEALDLDKHPIRGFKEKPAVWYDEDRAQYIINTPIMTAPRDLVMHGFRVHTDGGSYDHRSDQMNIKEGQALKMMLNIPTNIPLHVIDAKAWCRWKKRMVEE